MRRLLVLLAAAGLLVAGPASGYVKFGLGIDGRDVVVQWRQQPIRYFVNDSGVPGVSVDALDAALRRAFATWEAVPTARVRFSRAGFTGARPSDDDGMNVLGFESRPAMERTLAVTSYTIDLLEGSIVEADVVFNAAQPWSVAGGGEPGRFDLESIALHEIGHLLGLGHSALGETELAADGQRRLLAAGSIMFPIAFPGGSLEGRTLRADDIAGVSDLYPAGAGRGGSLSGRVTRDGRGVFGAHVVAYSLRSGELVGGFTLNESGEFVIAGLEPGPAIVRVEPLDDADLESFFEDSRPVDTGFAVTYYDGIAVVPRSGNAGGVDVAVRAR
ncbi:MAG TPA: matrixin family metalloprotease [Vicinamibacterales bacterium]